jgi:hypothetical protein
MPLLETVQWAIVGDENQIKMPAVTLYDQVLLFATVT